MIANILIKLLKIGLLFLLGNNVALGQIQNAGFEKEGKGAVPEGWHFNNQDSLRKGRNNFCPFDFQFMT